MKTNNVMSFLEIVNDLPRWHFFSKIQSGEICDDMVSLLSVDQQQVVSLSQIQAQSIFVAMCQRMAVQEESFIEFDKDEIKRAILCDGYVWMSCFTESGVNRDERVASQALNHALMPTLSKAKIILCNLYGNDNLGLDEYETIGDAVRKIANADTLIKVGLTFDDNLIDDIRVRLMAFGCEEV